MAAFNPRKDTIKILTWINDQSSTYTINKLDFGYVWDFSTTELTSNVLDSGFVQVDQLKICFELDQIIKI